MKVCGSDKGRKGYKQRDRGLPTVADGELMLEGWSIVSSKEGRGERGKEQVSSPCCSSPCYWGLNLGRRKGERACVHVGESLPPGLPASQNSPLPPSSSAISSYFRQLSSKQSRPRKLWDRETISHRNEFLPRARIQPHPQKVRRVVQYFSNFIQSSVFESSF